MKRSRFFFCQHLLLNNFCFLRCSRQYEKNNVSIILPVFKAYFYPTHPTSLTIILGQQNPSLNTLSHSLNPSHVSMRLFKAQPKLVPCLLYCTHRSFQGLSLSYRPRPVSRKHLFQFNFLISCLDISFNHLPRIMIFLNINFLFYFPSSQPPAQPCSCVSLLCRLGVQTDSAETLTWLGAGTHAGLGAARRGLTCFY